MSTIPLPFQYAHLFSLYPFQKPLIQVFSQPRKITTTARRLFSLKPLAVSSPIRNYGDERIDPTYLSCSMPHKNPLKVAVLVSGGVDSSVALRLLHAAGHSCTAFYLKIWFQVRNFTTAPYQLVLVLPKNMGCLLLFLLSLSL